jgi:hypothetical protein
VEDGSTGSAPPDDGSPEAPDTGSAPTGDRGLSGEAEGGGPLRGGELPPEVGWTRAFGGLGDDFVVDMGLDERGHLLVAGTFAHEAGVDMGGGLLADTGGAASPSPGQASIPAMVVARYRPDGTHLWSRAWSHPHAAIVPWRVVAGGGGDLFLAGQYLGGPVDLGTGLLANSSGTGFLMRVGPGGDTRWLRTVPPTRHLAKVGERLVLATALRGGMLTLEGERFTGPHAGSNLLTVEYSPEGKLAEVRWLGGGVSEATQLHAFAAGPGGTLLLGLTAAGRLSVGGRELALPDWPPVPLAVQLDARGDYRWHKVLDRTGSPPGVYGDMAVALAEDGTAYVASHFFGHVDFAGARHPAGTDGSVLLAAVDPDGTERWALTAGSGSSSEAANILWKPRLAPAAGGGVYLTGMSSEGLSPCGRSLPVSSGNSSVLAVRVGPGGTCEWAWTLERGAPLDVLPRANAHLLNLEAASALLVPAADGRVFIGAAVEDSFPLPVKGRAQPLGYDGLLFQLRP